MQENNLDTLKEEKWNTLSHALGVILALTGAVILLQRNYNHSLAIPAVWIYSISLVILFSASTAYHAARSTILKRRLRIVDHISIYYLIAGTYTPACLVILENSKGYLLLYFVWAIALFGTVLKLFFTGRLETFSLLLYAVMGWSVVIDLNYLINSVSAIGLTFVFLGGVFYTVGILFYANKKIPYNHLIWHFFVLAGAVLHWFFVYYELR